MQRSGRVGRDEFDQHRLALPSLRASPCRTLGQHAAHDILLGRGANTQVDKAGAGDFRAVEPVRRRQCRQQFRRHLAGIAPKQPRQLHGYRAGEVAVLRLFGALQRDHRPRLLRRHLCQRLRQEIGEVGPDFGRHGYGAVARGAVGTRAWEGSHYSVATAVEPAQKRCFGR